MSAAVLIIALLVLILLRVPVAFALLIPSLSYIILEPTALIGAAVQQSVAGVNNFALLAVPMFVLLGNLANVSGVTDRIYNLAIALLGNIRGSLGYVNIATSFGFSWMSGAAISDAAAMGRIQVPAMVKRNYSPEFGLGITAASSLIAPMIPPSIPAIIYAVTAGISVSALFLAGIVPALVLVMLLCVTVFIQTRKKPELTMGKSSARVKLKASISSLPAIGAGVVVLGGILGGIFTPTEASAAGVLYIFLLALLYRSLTWRKLYRLLLTSAETTGSILLIVVSAALLGWIFAREQIPQAMAEAFLGITDNPLLFLLLLNVLLLLIGAILEPTSAILILVPVLAPIGLSYGIDPVHLGVIVIFNLMIGLITPPVGLVLFVLTSVTGYSTGRVIKGVLPYYIPMLITLGVITYFPQLTLLLVNQ